MNRYAGFRVMIVDDNENNLFSLQALINRHMDVEVLSAGSGQRAIEMALDLWYNRNAARRSSSHSPRD